MTPGSRKPSATSSPSRPAVAMDPVSAQDPVCGHRSGRRGSRLLPPVALACAGALVLAGCGGHSAGPAPSSAAGGSSAPGSVSPGGSASPVGSASGGQPATCAALAASLPLEQQVGQLYMMGLDSPQPTDAQKDAIHRLGIGSVLVLANPPKGVAATAEMSRQVVGASADARIPVLVSTDQEGGHVQRLTGEGFSTIPSATVQATWSPQRLASSWQQWGGELARAGVHYNLAPDADLVRPADVRRNAPVGQLQRNYGTTVASVAQGDAAAIGGLRRAGVVSAIKHFPGLGAVSTNTDFGAAADTTTSATSPSVQVFRRGIAAGAGSVMVGSAVFRRIDAHQPGVFSPAVITGLLRQRLGYRGVVISDDLGAAAAVGTVPGAVRGTRFLQAGGDLVIDASPASVPAMVGDTVTRARADRAFAGRVTASATRVLALKAAAGQVRCTA